MTAGIALLGFTAGPMRETELFLLGRALGGGQLGLFVLSSTIGSLGIHMIRGFPSMGFDSDAPGISSGCTPIFQPQTETEIFL